MIEVFCVLLIGLTPALAPMAEPPEALLGPGWTLELKGQAYPDQVTRKPGAPE